MNQIEIFSMNLMLADQSQNQIQNRLPDWGATGCYQMSGGNFKLVGHVTSFASCIDSSRNLFSLQFACSPPSPSNASDVKCYYIFSIFISEQAYLKEKKKIIENLKYDRTSVLVDILTAPILSNLVLSIDCLIS